MSNVETEQRGGVEKALPEADDDTKATSIITTQQTLSDKNKSVADPWTQNYIDALEAGICWI